MMDGSEEQLCGIFSWLLRQGGNEKRPEKLLRGALGLRQNVSASNRSCYSSLLGKLFQGCSLLSDPRASSWKI